MCRVRADLTPEPLPFDERLANSKLGTLRETQCEKNQLLERVIFGKSDPLVELNYSKS